MNKVLSILAVNLFFFLCIGTVSSQSQVRTEKATQEQQSKKASVETPQLNNGEKWKVNEEMKPHIKKAEEAFFKQLSTRTPDYKELAKTLSEQNKNLIASCTMKGQSHEELHKWLYPHLELVKELPKAKSDDDRHRIVVELRESFATYHTYFE